ncbi:MAG: Tim44-like domain-containing protein [Methylococcales bacterium]|nr:Tim44-like domain-containing protein [Methylococcales bacterium]MDD5633090.1 Tim44-like domain-containing protein [Methylococcales bacterium]
MNRYTSIVVFCLIALSLSLGGMPDADAKRFGGGSSFGGRSTYSAPYQRQAIPPSRSASQQQSSAQNQAARQGMANRGGLMGMLGGLALGGLLGSLFFGGAFENFNFMDILVLGGIAFLLYKLFAAKAGAAQRPAYNRTATNYEEPQPAQRNPAGFNTDVLFNKGKNQSARQNFQEDGGSKTTPAVPEGFDQQAFLSGAKIAFTTLQKAWDDRDLSEIRGLSTDKVFAEIQEQLKTSATENHTDILKLDAELLEVREIGAELEAVVLFDTIMREDINAQTEQVREVWHFVKPKTGIQPKWLLDGIQQLED